MKKILLTVAISLLFAVGIAVVLHCSAKRFLDRLENVTYDWRYRLKYPESADDERFPDYGIHIVDIDDRSMEKMGSYWSWDRGYQARMLDSLTARFPAAVAFDVLFYEREDEKRYLRLAQILDNAVSGDTVLNRYRDKLNERLAASMDYDKRLALSIARSGRVTLGMCMSKVSEYRDITSQIAHRMNMNWHDSLRPSSALELPDSLLSKIRSTMTIIDGIYPENARAARQIGHVNAVDVSSVVRMIPLFYRFAKFPPVYLPMSVRVAADLFATPNEEIVFKPGKYLDIGKPFKIFKDAEGKVTFSYPDFTEAQFRIIAADREGILSHKDGQKSRGVSSYVVVFRGDGGVGLETRGGKASPKMLAALSSALFRRSVADNVDTNSTDKGRSGIGGINPQEMAVDEEIEISGGFTIRRDSEIEWEVFSGDDSLWLSALEVKTLSSLTPSDIELDSSAGVDRRLVTFDFWVKRENGVLVSSIPALRTPALNELLADGADAVLESVPKGSRRDFGAPARIPLRGGGSRHIVTYFGPKAKPFPYISFYDVMENNNMNIYQMEGKVFIVGSTSTAMFDIISAPHERVFPAVEIHASLLNSIFTGIYVRRLAEWQDILVTVAAGLFVALLGFSTRPSIGGILAAASLFAYSFVAFRLFDRTLLWVEMMRPMMTMALAFTAVTVYRYMTEERNRKFLQNTFKHYLSPDLIDMMYTRKLRPQLGGDTGIRTAYFTDIEGFSTFSEKLGSPTRLVELLNEYLSAMTDILLSRYGTLDKYEGDAIIAFFGAPVKMDDHAAQACHTALDMQKKLEELRVKWRSEGEKWPAIVHAMRMRIGINTGDITTGNMGSSVRMNYTMMGDAVNLAARLESAAKNYGVYTMISNYTHEMVSRLGLFETRKLDVITVVGRSEPVTVYELICRKGELTGEAADLSEIYNKGVDKYYRERDFRKALEFFERAGEFEQNRKINPDKPTPSKRFAEMCRKYIDNPPGDDWDGVNRLTSK
ncbi:MAG: adenylate/guanylate cyclase domain-containing protein [Chitinispirillales bacterium]|jgi:adenylate cyclase|nr:adenylate/guanylate cyclase domain-containing protein [Chitinispirillales bacterium]